MTEQRTSEPKVGERGWCRCTDCGATFAFRTDFDKHYEAAHRSSNPLVQRLRFHRLDKHNCDEEGMTRLMGQAADEIERLTRERDATDKMAKNLGDALIVRGNQLSNMTAERDRLMREIDDRRYLTSGLIDQKDAEIDRLTLDRNKVAFDHGHTLCKLETARAALEQVETVMMLVEPRSHKAEYLAALKAVREALRGERGEKLLQEGLLGEK